MQIMATHLRYIPIHKQEMANSKLLKPNTQNTTHNPISKINAL
jgi:hypothetical protein